MINEYDESYYIIFPDYEFDDYDNELIPTDETANSNWYFEKLNFGMKPLSFTSSNDDLDFLRKEYAIAFDDPNFAVTSKLKELIDSGLYGCQFFPAIVKGEQSDYVEGLWMLNTYEDLDCVDFKRSKYFMPGDGTTEVGGFPIKPDMDAYRLRKDVLDAIPEGKRLIFQVANTSTGAIFFHEKVVKIFERLDIKGIRFFKVSEFEYGDQNF